MNQNISKSQRRKQRLIERGIVLGEQAKKSTVPSQQPSARLMSAAPSRVRRTSRTARRRARQRMSGRSAIAAGRSVNVQDYLSALINPEMALGAKVPDEIGYPTGTFQLEAHGTLNCGTGGDSCAVFVIPSCSTLSTTGAAPIFTATGGTTVGNLGTWTGSHWNARASVMALYGEVRPVSAVLEVSYIGSTANDAGQITAGCTYIRGAGNTKYQGATFNDLSLQPDMEIWPSKNGVRVVWKPLDNSNFEFSDFSDTTTNGTYSKIPALSVAITGIPFTGNQYMYECVVNFEGVPNTDMTSLVNTEPSPISLDSVRRAFEWAQQAGNNVRPLVGVVGQAIEFGRTAYNLLGNQADQRSLIARPKYRRSTPLAAIPNSKIDSDEHGKEEEEEFYGQFDNLSINPTAPPVSSLLSQRSVDKPPGSAAKSSPMPSRKS